MLGRIKSFLIAVLLLSGVVLYYLFQREAQRNEELEWNQSSLLDSVHRYSVMDSLSAASIGVLELELSELRAYRSKDKELIKNLGLRLSRLQSISTTGIESSYSFRVKAQDITSGSDTLKWSIKNKWINFYAEKQKDTLESQIIVYDTIVQVLHRVPRFKFLGIWFGTKGVRQEIISRNPHTRISAAEYIEITR